MNVLGMDYGSKRIGLAWCDTNLGVVLPFGTLEKNSLKAKVEELVKILVQEKIDRLVVGFPLGLNGKENAGTERVKKFIFELQKFTDVPVFYHDERFSSYGADAIGEGASRDERSAMLILEGYLKKTKNL